MTLLYSGSKAQNSDTTIVRKENTRKHSPRLAATLSAIIPGTGQIYNRKYWKTPIIYGALGGLGYFFITNQNEYTYHRKNLIAEADDDVNTINESGLSQDQLQQQKIYYRKFRDLAAVGLIAVYAFNIIDANVDAHLKTFDVSDDLSLKINLKPLPNCNTSAGLAFTPGLSLKLNWK